MLFYTSIFIASFITVLLARFFYGATANKNKLVKFANIEDITSGVRVNRIETTDHNITHGLPTKSVQEVGVVSSNLHKAEPAKPAVCNDQNTTLLSREKRLLSMHESYKTRLRTETEPLTLAMVSKPFRRKVAQ